MSYIEISRQNEMNAQKAKALDKLERDMNTDRAIQDALKKKEEARIQALVSEFSPTQYDFELQRGSDELARRLGKPLSQSDYATAARNWLPSNGGNIENSVQQYLSNN